MLLNKNIFFIFPILTIVGGSCQNSIPPDRSGLFLKVDGTDENCSPGDYMIVNLTDEENRVEKWSYFTSGRFPVEVELWSKPEGQILEEVEIYDCPEENCKEVEENGEFITGRGNGRASLKKTKRQELTIFISCVKCGNGIIEKGEECDSGNFESSSFCQQDCSFPEVRIVEKAGASADSITAFSVSNSRFLVMWSENAGQSGASINSLKGIIIDENGNLNDELLSVENSCAGNDPLKLADGKITGLGWDLYSGLVIYGEKKEYNGNILCFASFNENGIVSRRGMFSFYQDSDYNGIYPAGFTSEGGIVIAGKEGNSIILHHSKMPSGEEISRGLVAQLFGDEKCLNMNLVTIDGNFITILWESGSSQEIQLKMSRWIIGTGGNLIPVDTSGLTLASFNHGRSEFSALLDTHREFNRIVSVVLSDSSIELFSFEKGTPQNEISAVSFASELAGNSLLSDAETDSSGQIYILLSRFFRLEKLCLYTLLKLHDNENESNPEIVQQWMHGEVAGCDGELVPLTKNRFAVVLRSLYPDTDGQYYGSVRMDIVSAP